MKAALVLLLLCATAHAEPPRNTFSIPLTALPLHGLSVELEHDLRVHHLSVVGALGFRSTAEGDYDSATLDVGGEVRYWPWHGLYVAGRLDVGRTTLTDALDEQLGAVDSISVTSLVGYRFSPWRGLEIRPYAGVSVRHERSGDVGWTRPGIAYGLAVGWRF